jgi:hypothetical protein
MRDEREGKTGKTLPRGFCLATLRIQFDGVENRISHDFHAL